MAYRPHTDTDRVRMRGALGIATVGELFEDIPPDVRAGGLDLPDPVAEQDLMRELESFSAENRLPVSFIGAGIYHHYVPPVVDDMIRRGEFATAYTPYQPEVSQGTLQTIYEFQSLIAELTGLDVVSASHYDGATATVEAALMAMRAKRSRRVLVSRGVNPHYIEVARTYFGDRLLADEVPLTTSGTTDLSALRQELASGGEPVAGVILAQPNALGLIEDMHEAERVVHGGGALLVSVVEPTSLAVLAPPGEYGADISAGEGQPLGIAQQFGGPHLGLLAATTALMRQIPGRIVGTTSDADGRHCYVMTMRAREQDIRREKAASNICTNQALCALAATVYLAAIGPRGLENVAATGAERARQLEHALIWAGAERLHTAAYLNEFAVTVPNAERVHASLLEEGILAGLPLASWFPDDARFRDALLVCATEMTTSEEIDEFARALKKELA
ncbi:MAG: aminomethyl-transferring glycine dehydrogenase subunit GcvPA [Actinomycetota bacterium]